MRWLMESSLHKWEPENGIRRKTGIISVKKQELSTEDVLLVHLRLQKRRETNKYDGKTILSEDISPLSPSYSFSNHHWYKNICLWWKWEEALSAWSHSLQQYLTLVEQGNCVESWESCCKLFWHRRRESGYFKACNSFSWVPGNHRPLMSCKDCVNVC